MEKHNQDIHSDPNINYETIESIFIQLYVNHFPVKTIRYNKHKHKKFSWITAGIVRSIRYKDKLYRKLKHTPQSDTSYNTISVNLRVCKKYFNKTITNAKKIYYGNLFDQFKANARKTWDFYINGLCVTNTTEVAHKFNEFFVNVGRKLAHTIPSTNTQTTFTSYLKNKSLSTFNFKPETSAGHDSISTVLRQRCLSSVVRNRVSKVSLIDSCVLSSQFFLWRSRLLLPNSVAIEMVLCRTMWPYQESCHQFNKTLKLSCWLVVHHDITVHKYIP